MEIALERDDWFMALEKVIRMLASGATARAPSWGLTDVSCGGPSVVNCQECSSGFVFPLLSE
jgi:hypothetical protein